MAFSEFNEWLQSRLTAHEFPVGGIDGYVGPTTIAAIKKFQRSRKLPVTGQADVKTVEALRKSSTSSVEPMPDRDREDLPTNVRSNFPRQRDVLNFYGEVGTNQTRIVPPWKMRLAWDKHRFIQKMTLHEKVAESALRAMTHVEARYGDSGIKLLGLDLFGGSLNVRKMRGGSRYSMHSWGIAIDFDPERNQLRWKKPKARLSLDDVIPFWECWENEGWIALGRERNFDWMHVQAARL